MQVAFWSPFSGRGSTTSCISISLQWALNFDSGRGLIVNMQHNSFGLETNFFSEKQLDMLNRQEYGIDSLDRLSIVNQIIGQDEFKNYTKEIVKNRLSIVLGSNKTSYGLFDDCFKKSAAKILKTANQYYDMVFVDVNSNMPKHIIQTTLSSSEIIVVTLDQNESTFSCFLKDSNMQDKKIIVVIGRYDVESKYSKEYIRRDLGYKNSIFSIPYNTNFLDAVNEHKVKNYFCSNNKTIKSEKDEIFFDEISDIVDTLVSMDKNRMTDMNPIGFNRLSARIRRALGGD